MTRSIIFSAFLLTLLIGLSVFAGTPQDWGKWKEGELLLENHSFEEDLAAWGFRRRGMLRPRRTLYDGNRQEKPTAWKTVA